MARRVEVTVPAGETDTLVPAIERLPGVFGLRVQRGVCVQPPGDLLVADVTNPALHRLMKLVDARGLTRSTTVTTAELASAIAPHERDSLLRETSDATWEEMDAFIQKETQMTSHGLVLMAVTGALAAIGFATDALHLVIGAMVIAPGFEPLVHVALGLVSGSSRWRSGLVWTATGYASLIAAAAVMAAILTLLGVSPLGGQSSYLSSPGVLVGYWTRLDVTVVLVAVPAALAGALLVAIGRETLTAGVMIALALVPSAALIGIGAVAVRPDVIVVGVARLALEAVIVVAASLVLLTWKSRRVQRRRMAV